MEKEFIPYEQALALKELGFNEPCFGRFDGRGKHKGKIWYEMPNTGQDSIPVGDVLAPLYQQAFRWFREKHDLQAEIIWRSDMKFFCYKTCKFKYDSHDFSKDDYKTYEEAKLKCLKKLIEIIKNK